MRRRAFIALLGGAATWPLAARAQERNVPLIGFLGIGSGGSGVRIFIDAFLKGLAETGYVEGKTVRIEYRWAPTYKELPALATDLVSRSVTVLVASPLSGGLAAKAATKTIPIVFAGGGDPVEVGLVDSFNHPGGNATGIISTTQLIVPKRFQHLRDLVPTASVFAMLVNPDARATPSTSAAAIAAAEALGVQLHILRTKSSDELSDAFVEIGNLHAGALLVTPDPFFSTQRDKVLSLANQYRLPGIYPDREWALAGGLMSYGSSLPGIWYQVGGYTGRILKGERPADLPVQQPTKFDLVINLKTAKALGLTVPETLLTTSDEVIE
jgi:putative tryptophan/tyrosine transport system substrate-binding protein